MDPLGIALLIIVFYLTYWYLTKDFDYWKKKGIPYITPVPIFGSIRDLVLLKKGENIFYQEVCKKFPNERFIGLYNLIGPVLVITDPEDIKMVMITDFKHFRNRRRIVKEDPSIANVSLADLPGKFWKPVRQKFTPVFTTGKLKNMVPLMLNVGDDLTQYLNKKVEKDCEMDALEFMMKFTLDVVSSIGFGIKANTFHDEDSPFFKISKEFFRPNTLSFINILIRRFLFSIYLKYETSSQNKSHKKFMYFTIKKVIEERERSGIIRNDLIDILLEVKQKDKEMQKDNSNIDQEAIIVDDKFIIMQALTLFFGGFSSTSSLLSLILHELALHQDIQNKVYQEIISVLQKNDGKLSYEAIFQFEYLDMVIQETERKYPVGNIKRVCTSDYTFPGTNLTIKKGVHIIIPLYYLHHNPKYFSDPDEFIPERFRREEKEGRNSMVFLPFGIGPRNCIGLRLAFLQVMVGLVTFLKDYQVKPCNKTIAKVEFDFKPIIPVSRNGLWLSIIKRK